MVSGLSSPLPDNVWDRLGLRAAGAYGGYLAAYSAGTLPAGVLIVRPVLDVQGNLLLSPHQPFDADALAALQGRSLAEPLARSVTLVSPLTVDMLRRDLTDWARQDSFFVVLEEHRPFLQQLATHAESLPEHPLLQQHLSVMANQMPGLYKRALFTALMAVLLGDEMRLSPADRRALFWAALYHDIGMLYVEPEILHKVEPLTLDEWSHIQLHVEIAQALMMLIPGLPDSVGLAVLEHQERCDGTGYPAAKLDSELSLLGQLLALADSVVAIYFNRLLPYGRGWRDAIPIIERSTQEYLFRAVDLLSALVRRSDLPVASVVSGSAVTDFLQQFHSQHERLQCWFDALKGCLLEIGFTHRDRRLHSLQNVVLHLATAYKGVVAQQPALDRQLVNLMEQPATEIPQDLQDHCLLQLEVVFHLRRLSLMLQQYLAAGGSADELIQSKLEACFGQISGYLEQSVDR